MRRSRHAIQADRASQPSLSRRALFQRASAWALGWAAFRPILGQSGGGGAQWRTAVLQYLETLARADGGYAWADQLDSHLTPTFAVIGAYRVLETMPPHPGRLAEFVRTHHPSQLKKLEQEHREFEFQQVQSLVWLGEDASRWREAVRGWRRPTVYLKQYERHGWPVFRHEMAAFICRALLGLPLEDLQSDYVAYLDSRRRGDGSFNNTPAGDGSEGHVLNTWWGLRALHVLGRAQERKETTIAWLQSCQRESGGFSWQPGPAWAGVEDAAYTWAAVRSLALLEAAPLRLEACVRYLHSLWTEEGGFADRPGWASNPLATYYVLEALKVLGGLDSPGGVSRLTPRRPAELSRQLGVFSIQVEAHGRGSPAEAVDLAGALRIHLWGAKNANPGWLSRAQALADRGRIPVRFFVSNEEYGTWVDVPGLGTYSHTSDLMAPAGSQVGPSLAGPKALSWAEFRERRLVPLTKAGGRLIWQFGENEELARLYLDDSLERGGYAAISTFHFGNPDFTNSEPFLHRWRGQIPFVALQDAHGEEPWWFADMTAGFRTVFLAMEPTWEGWLTALERNWVVAIRHDAVSRFKTWMHGGSREVLDFVRQREPQWRWWDNPEIRRPLVSIVVVRPEDEFEVARPDRGLAIRIRCAWENTTQGLPKEPITELVRLSLDGAELSPVLVAPKAPRGSGYRDHYHVVQLADPPPGRHTLTATVRVLDGGTESRRTIDFSV